MGATIQSKTKGIWMWCVPHPKQADQTLVLLDTEGLGDVEKVRGEIDYFFFLVIPTLENGVTLTEPL